MEGFFVFIGVMVTIAGFSAIVGYFFFIFISVHEHGDRIRAVEKRLKKIETEPDQAAMYQAADAMRGDGR